MSEPTGDLALPTNGVEYETSEAIRDALDAVENEFPVSGEYVPTTEEVRALFATGNREVNNGGDEWYAERDARPFDRWLTAHDAEVRAEGIAIGYKDGYRDGQRDEIAEGRA